MTSSTTSATPPSAERPLMTSDLPYRNSDLPTAERVEDLLSRMTIQEKAGQLTQYFLFDVGELPDDFDIDSLPEEHQVFVRQPRIVLAAAKNGGVGSLLFIKDPAVANRYQREVVENSRHGIPLLFGFDVIHGLRTVLPVPIALAATWDPAIVEAGQRIAAREARASGIHWSFAPMIDIARDPRWGRIVEGAGEDPHLGSAVAAAQVRGFQGDLGPSSILAGPKHFAGYGAARGGRDYEDAEISESELHNVYLPPFKAAIDAGAANIMSAYMDLNGVPASGNRRLLTELLRDELGFDGFVVSDANAVKSMETQHFAADPTDAAARAIRAGNDMEMAMSEPAFDNLPAAIERGLLDEEQLDTSVRRVLTAKFALGLFENPYADAESAETVLTDPAHRQVARTAAERAIVLLKNNGALPLADDRGTIAVIGRLADSKRDTLGPWVFGHHTEDTVTLLEGLRSRAVDSAAITHAPGVGIPDRLFPSPFDRQDPDPGENPWASVDDEQELTRAVETAAAADVAIVVVGERQNQIGELASRSTLDLPGRQLEMVQQIIATGTPVVVVVMSGRPLDLHWIDAHAAAVLQVWYPGTQGGDAVAAAVFGDVSPAGRLPFSWPRHVGQVPMIYSHNRTFSPENSGTRYWDEESTPLYPFGFGLSYATFEYSNLRVEKTARSADEPVTVSVDVANTSDRDGDDVVQLYVHQRYGTSSRPVRELKGFERVHVARGDVRTVRFELGPDQLRYWSAATGSWVLDNTVFDVWVGGASTATLTTTFESQ
ncbi:beta-glucosidase [Rathayibacter sp. PhB152]|uniref:glycoside hydrolase family 3 N-terminal domain-containing protein n=1 Tax=Rathayibacter sp. PhB152 TaxID=2485190 RepID=UPI000F91EA0F|nr:glycoside hydrolase family 3 N-terminal domain-containing protein [Rathayibacter sp. PhB152]ROQ59094.1 beta-glucosidase [Rathayibacter sp. PhB152]